MRWKLLFIASLLAAIVGTGVGFGIAIVLARYPIFGNNSTPPLIIGLLILAGAMTTASVFVYRHTARHRRLQAFLTVVLVMMLSLAAILLIGRYVTQVASFTSVRL